MTSEEREAHAQAIRKILENKDGNIAVSPFKSDARVTSSWQRSLEKYRLDPGRKISRRILDANELKDATQRMGELLDVAKIHIDELERHVAPANYCIMFTDGFGATIDYRNGNDADNNFVNAGLRNGVCWSESEEGTCGIGTAIAEQEPVLIHRLEHFKAENVPLSCSAAPIFNINDELVAVLNASSVYTPYNRDSQTLVFNFVQDKALQIENAYAERSLQSHWRLCVSPRPDNRVPANEWIIAFNEAGQIIGANRLARQYLLGHSPQKSGISIEEIFHCNFKDLFSNAHTAPGLAIPLRQAKNGRQLYGVLRAPLWTRKSGSQIVPPEIPMKTSSLKAFDHMAIGDKSLHETVTKACKLANAKIPIMLLGETGTGKEVLAKAIHNYSQRGAKPFVALNCAAIPETLIESELFGYRDGAFTGAKTRGSKGKILQADGGTLFLDEIGDMPLLLQSRLLRVLAENEVQSLGAEEPTAVNLHVICATHQSLNTLISEGRFREDLYYRLSGAIFRLPTLRERSDIVDVIKQIFREESLAIGKGSMEIEEEVIHKLVSYPWPGNIRELRHVMRYACTLEETFRLTLKQFPSEICFHDPAKKGASSELESPESKYSDPLIKKMIDALKLHKWQISAAAREMGISRTSFYRNMERYELDPEALKIEMAKAAGKANV